MKKLQPVKIDVVSIFPEYFDVLGLSLIGKAQENGLLSIDVRNLRDATHDRHRTVDGPPAGGGAGMVMRPEPWGEMLDELLASADNPVIIFPSPAGELFTQQSARQLASENHLIFGCGRYEGIDQRVFTYAASRARVRLVSLGDYVLNGGEVAAIAMIEAIVRLIPGVVGNPDSLVEESHEAGLLEYPNFTQPALWQGLEIPPVLLSGHHAEIAKWRREQQLERTREVRPDLLSRLTESGEGAID